MRVAYWALPRVMTAPLKDALEAAIFSIPDPDESESASRRQGGACQRGALAASVAPKPGRQEPRLGRATVVASVL